MHQKLPDSGKGAKDMTYFPSNCFSLIKEFADISETRYHHNQLAKMVKAHVAFCYEKYNRRNECFPLVYKIQFLEELAEDHKKRIVSYTSNFSKHCFYKGGRELLISSYDELLDEIDEHHAHLRWFLHL